ncbi:MAG: alpha/beta hydrolase [Mycobacteriaceae bacterium]|nr:alpha/beta hydrolase [Mycobacteriaceae bacterium]
MRVGTSVTTRCSRAGAVALQQGTQLAAEFLETYRAGSLLLRGSPFALGWVAGWLTTEFPPHVLTGHALSRVTPPCIGRTAEKWAAQRADRILTTALTESLGADYRDRVFRPIGEQTDRTRPTVLQVAGSRRRYAAQTSNIAYGPGGRGNLLDVWRHPDLSAGSHAPVLLQVPGGAWSINDKRGQAYPLLNRMVEQGWICVSINYSKSPRHAWPAHIIDVKRAIAWVRESIADYGGDPDFIALTGGSAGAHLASLAALTANDLQLQPGFENADTTVQAAAPYYGIYDFTRVEHMHEIVRPFLEQFVMQTRYEDHPELFAQASPISHVHRGAPPFFVLHGEKDPLVPSTQAQAFCAALRDSGAATVCHAELANAHHAFDALGTVRSHLAADAVADFLGVVYGRHRRVEAATLSRAASSAS